MTVSSIERDIGKILEAQEQGKIERGELKRSLEQNLKSNAEFREAIAGMRADYMMMNARIQDFTLLASRVTVMEARVGRIAEDLHVLEGFIRFAKTTSVKFIIAILIGLAFGGAAFSKLIDFFLKIPYR